MISRNKERMDILIAIGFLSICLMLIGHRLKTLKAWEFWVSYGIMCLLMF